MGLAVKVCGVKDAAVVEAAVRGGADYLGFIFFPPSPRWLPPAAAADLARLVPAGIRKVAVLVDPDDAFIDEVTGLVGPDILQLHGGETPARARAIRDRTGIEVMKVIRVGGAEDIALADRFRDAADRILFDTKPPKGALLPGGNGASFDWSLLDGADPGLPWGLAGGLDAGNLADAVRLSGASMVDVSSGVESRPGVKDPAKVQHFLAVAAALCHGATTAAMQPPVSAAEERA